MESVWLGSIDIPLSDAHCTMFLIVATLDVVELPMVKVKLSGLYKLLRILILLHFSQVQKL
jgi:hypothetical protein